MNIQIFGTNKCFDTKKAQRYFKERGIKFQFIDLTQKNLSKGEYNSIKAAVGSMEALIDEKSRISGAIVLASEKFSTQIFTLQLFESSVCESKFKFCLQETQSKTKTLKRNK